MTPIGPVPDHHEPSCLVAVVGTATAVGKTWAAASLAAEARRRGLRVAARKPAQSFDAGDAAARTDAHLLAAATGERPDEVCPAHRWYPRPFAPPMAAASLGRPRFTVADLIDEMQWPAGVDLALVETAGAVGSPIADDGDSRDLVARLRPDRVLLVADAGLGTIAAVRAAMDALADRSSASNAVVLLNRFVSTDELHRRNAAWLGERDGYEVVTTIEPVADALLGRPG